MASPTQWTSLSKHQEIGKDREVWHAAVHGVTTIDPAIPYLGIYPEINVVRKDMCTPVFIAALFIIVKREKQPKCPSTNELI